jgi:hypothetical protein
VISPSQRPLRTQDKTTYKHKRQISTPLARFEPGIPATKRLQTYAYDRAATGSATSNISLHIYLLDRLCGVVVSVEDYKHRGPGSDSRALLRIFLRELGLERGPLSLVIG